MAGKKKILVPFNFTDYDDRVLHYLMRDFAEQKWLQVTLFNVYTPLPELDTQSSPLLKGLKTTIASFHTELREKESLLKKAIEDLQDNGFSAHQVDYVFKAREKDIGGEIVDFVVKGSYDTIVMSHRHGSFIRRSLTRNVHDKVLGELTHTTIIIIT